MRTVSHSSSSSWRGWAMFSGAGLLVAVCAWWFSRPEVELSRQDYKATLALYRVCNLQSSDALEQIESQLRQEDASSDDAGRAAIEQVIAEAKEGHWRAASKNCRELLGSQVNR